MIELTVSSDVEIVLTIIAFNKLSRFDIGSKYFTNLLEQTVGFEKIQLIFVEMNDSPDVEFKKKDLEPYDNISVITGTENFKDIMSAIRSDNVILDWNFELYARNAFSEILRFSEKHILETDVYLFNSRFPNGISSKIVSTSNADGVVSLRDKDSFTRYDGGSVLIKKDILTISEFTDIKISDYLFVLVYQIAFSKKMSVGVCKKAVCTYNSDCCEFRYLETIKSRNFSGYDLSVFSEYHKKIYDYYISEFGFVPRITQRYFCDDFYLRTKTGRKNLYLDLNDKDLEEYQNLFSSYLSSVNDQMIMGSKLGFAEHKAYLMYLKYSSFPDFYFSNGDIVLHYGDVMLQSVFDMFFSLDFLHIENDKLMIEGQFKYFGIPDTNNIEVFAENNGLVISCENEVRSIGGVYSVGNREIQKCIWFKLETTLNRIVDDYELEFFVRIGELVIKKRVTTESKYFPINFQLNRSYYYSDNWVVTYKNNSLRIQYINDDQRKNYELAYCKQLDSCGKNGRKAAKIRTAYFSMLKYKKNPIWLFSNRVTMAGNNGEAFFEYVYANHPEIESYFVIDEKSDDSCTLKSRNYHTVSTGSLKHKLLYMLCDFNISSQFVNEIRNPFGEDSRFFMDFTANEKFVYLQHGVIKDDMSWVNQKRNRNFYGHIVSAQKEYDSMINGIDFSEKNLWLTGLARFDKLFDAKKQVICFSPTWRQWLMNPIDEKGIRAPKYEEIKNSICFNFYQSILTDKRLIDSAKAYGYEIWFNDHPFMRNFDKDIYNFDDYVEIKSDCLSHQINAEASLMITDYSSAVFDFAYLRKPVIYAQPDKDIFFQHHTFSGMGYFDYEKDGFGEVVYDSESAIDLIIDYMRNSCRIKEEYRNRIDEFFEYSDNNNCRRIFDKICASYAFREYPLSDTSHYLMDLIDYKHLLKCLEVKPLSTASPARKEKKIDYISYVPERFYNGDLGLKALWWCFKGWLSYKFSKKNKNGQ